MIEAQDRIMNALAALERQYPGTTASLTLYTNGDGAVELAALLGLPPQRVAIDFEHDDDIDDILRRLRQAAASAF